MVLKTIQKQKNFQRKQKKDQAIKINLLQKEKKQIL